MKQKKLNLLYFLFFTALLLQVGCENKDSPTCTITSLENGEQIPHGTRVLIAVDANAGEGRITGVDVYIDDFRIERNTFPYEHEWNTLEEEIGSHTIRATATDDNGLSTTHEILVTIAEGLPIADFAAFPPSASLASSARFFNESINNPESWSWDFGDGNTSELKNPTHTYSAEGVYTVSLTVTNSFGSDTEIKMDYFTVTAPLIDYDGNVYSTIQIGSQLWMQENLKVTHYADGTALVDGTGAGNIANDYSSRYYFAYNDDESNVDTYGRLYTWAAVMEGKISSDEDPSMVQGVCPAGWHVPSDDEWKELEIHLGMNKWDVNKTGWRGEEIGLKLKESSTNYWNQFYADKIVTGTNESGFAALPAGMNKYERIEPGLFKELSNTAAFWSTTESISSFAWGRRLHYKEAGVYRYDDYKYAGYSVRCIKD